MNDDSLQGAFTEVVLMEISDHFCCATLLNKSTRPNVELDNFKEGHDTTLKNHLTEDKAMHEHDLQILNSDLIKSQEKLRQLEKAITKQNWQFKFLQSLEAIMVCGAIYLLIH